MPKRGKNAPLNDLSPREYPVYSDKINIIDVIRKIGIISKIMVSCQGFEPWTY